MGRKRKVPQGIQLKHWLDSDDDSSNDEVCPPPKATVTAVTAESILRQDLSPTPSVAPSTIPSLTRSSEIQSSEDNDFEAVPRTGNIIPPIHYLSDDLVAEDVEDLDCLLYTSPSPRD